MQNTLTSKKIKGQNESGAQKKRTPRKITPTYLHNAGLYYLQRFSASSGHFREIMSRKVKKSCRHHTEQDFESCMEMVDTLVQKFIELDLLNDDLYARGMVSALRRQGKSRRAILAKLGAKSVPAALITQQLDEYDTAQEGVDSELIAALILTRKRKIGPYKKDKDIEEKKSLSILARAGFNYDTSRRVLKMEYEAAAHLLNRSL